MSDWDMVAEGECEAMVPPPTQCPPVLPPALQQLDVIVVDVSRSMKARSTADPDKTREDVSKVAFHTMVDKMVCLELEHAVGLVSFGATVRVVPPTRAYEAFHTELGRLDATENRTRLFDAIAAATDTLLEYRRAHAAEVGASCALRVFALTDGDDNASALPAWQVAQRMQAAGVILDAMPMACANPVLQALVAATGGLCVSVTSVEQGVALFEREAVVHVASRVVDASAESPRAIQSEDDFRALLASVSQSAAPLATTAATVRPVAEAASRRAVCTLPSAPSPASAGSGTAHAALRRVLREFADMQSCTVARAFVVEGDPTTWKVLLYGPAGTPYEGGCFVLSVMFPRNYPFVPMKVRFLTPVYHCNVNADGAVCLDVLKDRWSPALGMAGVARCLVELLQHPNPDDPLDSMKASIYRQDRAAYDSAARRTTEEHAAPEGRIRSLYGLEGA